MTLDFQPFLAALGLYHDPADLTTEDLGSGYLYDTSRYFPEVFAKVTI